MVKRNCVSEILEAEEVTEDSDLGLTLRNKALNGLQHEKTLQFKHRMNEKISKVGRYCHFKVTVLK